MNETVLIVEDAKDTAELLRYNLRKEGYATVTAEKGDEAIRALQTFTPDLILLDIMLPGLNGWEICETLRSNGVVIPIVILSALSSKDEQIKGLTLGADDYISKPFSVKELMLRVKRLLDQQKVIKELQAKEKEGNDTIKYMIHELKNSLIGVACFSELAMGKSETDKYLERIRSSALHMDSILNDASLLAKLELGEKLFPVREFDIAEQINWAIGAINSAAQDKGIGIRLASVPSRIIQGNITAMRQVLVNLLSNSIKYNREQGNIWVYTKESDEWMDICIKDAGYGIPDEELPKIFEKFYRAKGSERTKGTGLGLYLVKLLMEAMDGRVTVESKEGTGSTFTVSFKKEVSK